MSMEGVVLFLCFCMAFILAMMRLAETADAPRPAPPLPQPLPAPLAAAAPMVVHYRTSDGEAFYSFSIEQRASGRFRSYIVAQPDYGSRATDAHSTHRHWDIRGRAYVCWSRPITSEQDALRVSAAWADATQEYIKSGQPF
jgi:hypothetical protein